LKHVLPIFVACSLALLARPVLAGDLPPTEQLLRLLPDQPAFCLVVRDVRGHSARLAESEFFTQFKEGPFKAVLGENKQVAGLAELDKQLRALLGTGLQELRDDVLGDGFVFAYWPAQSKQPERGVFLVKARRADLLAKLVSSLRELGAQSGDLKHVRDGVHAGSAYHQLQDKEGKSTFYVLKDQLLAVTEDEESLKKVIDRTRGTPPASALAKQLDELGLGNAFATLLVNPRSFDAEIEKKAANVKEQDAALVRTLARWWRSAEAIAFSLRLEREVSLAVSLRLDPQSLPEGTRRWLAEPPHVSELWRRFPEHTMLAAAGRADFKALFELLSEVVPEPKREKDLAELVKTIESALGLDLKKDILPNLGPDWGVFVAAPPAAAPGWFPQAVFALRVQHKPDQHPLDEAAFESLRTLVGIIAITQSKPGKSITVRTQTRDGVQMVTLHGPDVFPPGCQPTLAIKAGYLLAASSPEAVAAFRDVPRPATATDANEHVIARISLKELAAYVGQANRRKALAEAIAHANGLPSSELEAGMEKAVDVLRYFDRIELVERHSPEQVHIALQLHAVKSFRK
jgi:hypothetical protein